MPPNPPKNEWKALAGRISVFPMAPLSPPASVLDLYRGVWQHEPDEFHKQPNPLMPSVAQGRISNVVANCMVQPSRIDFGLQPVPPANMSFAAIEDTIQLRNELERIISAIGKGAIINPIVRVGVFLNFIILAPNFLEANKILLGSMPPMYRPGIADEEDFSFQINRSRAINEIDNVTMNFITRWSVNRFQVFNLALPVAGAMPGQVGQSPFNLQPTQFLGASMTFDNNNIPQPTAINSDKQAALLTEGLKGILQMLRESETHIAGF